MYDPVATLKQAEMVINNPRKFESGEDDDGEDEEPYKWSAQEDPVFRAMTLSEFQNGTLMIDSIPDKYRTFGIDMLCKLQEDYNCTLISEKALAELATLSYVRVLELQHILDSSLARPEKHQLNMLYIGIVGKELDRANRQFITAIQTLRMMRQSPLKINIKTNTAIVGQNQVIQENQNVNPI